MKFVLLCILSLASASTLLRGLNVYNDVRVFSASLDVGAYNVAYDLRRSFVGTLYTVDGGTYQSRWFNHEDNRILTEHAFNYPDGWLWTNVLVGDLQHVEQWAVGAPQAGPANGAYLCFANSASNSPATGFDLYVNHGTVPAFSRIGYMRIGDQCVHLGEGYHRLRLTYAGGNFPLDEFEFQAFNRDTLLFMVFGDVKQADYWPPMLLGLAQYGKIMPSTGANATRTEFGDVLKDGPAPAVIY